LNFRIIVLNLCIRRDAGMKYLVGMNWLDYFDVVVTNARKPKFFSDSNRSDHLVWLWENNLLKLLFVSGLNFELIKIQIRIHLSVIRVQIYYVHVTVR